jgi:1-pyrroline-5-carboxylate dehydrogenase
MAPIPPSPAARSAVPPPVNEPVRQYAPESPERASLQATLREMAGDVMDVPLFVGAREVRTAEQSDAVMPHDHRHVVARVHQATPEHVRAAIVAAAEAHREWSRWPFEARAAVFLRAAELLAGPWRDRMNAATMLNQSKTPHQAEIDAACELIDFFRYNVHYAQRLMEDMPISPLGSWNRLDFRPLEGFVLAVTPFNFTSIAVNLPTAPALLGNTVVWKPAVNAAVSAHVGMELLRAAGLPDGVINVVHGDPPSLVGAALDHPDLSGMHFTGSTTVLRQLWHRIGERLDTYRDYPRVVGESGGKDFVLVHASAEPVAVATALVRGAFEYQGQKCSAASRAYLPRSRWPEIQDALVGMVGDIRMGDPADFSTFMGAVIDRRAFDRHREAIELARSSPAAEIIAGGGTDDSTGYFVEPTVIVTTDPAFDLMRRELFGPILTVFVYEDADWERTLDLVDASTPYGLTGAVFGRDRAAIEGALDRLRYAAGNVYINDKPTGAVVGQQPFGGGRASGTNDKAGSILNLLRWVSPRAIKETWVPPTRYEYPYMG